MRRVLNDRRIEDLLQIYGYKPDIHGSWRLGDILSSISLAFPNYPYFEYRTFRSTLGGSFGRLLLSSRVIAFGRCSSSRSRKSYA